VTKPIADTTFGLTKVPAIFSLVVPLTAVAAALHIFEMTTERWLGGVCLVNSLWLLEFPGSSLASDVFLL
jgi:hypothetical protein